MEKDYKIIQEVKVGNEEERRILIKSLEPVVGVVSRNYPFIDRDSLIFRDMVNKVFNTSLEGYTEDGKWTFSKYFKRNLEEWINSYIIKLMESDQGLIIINDYLKESNLKKGLTRLISFFDKIGYFPSYSVIGKLFSTNKRVYSYVEDLLDLDFGVKRSKIDDISGNPIFTFMLEVYCSINNIEIQDDKSCETEDKKLVEVLSSMGQLDSVKLYLAECKEKALSKEEREELLNRLSKGDKEAGSRLVEGNLGLVIKVAKNYLGKGLSFLDLIQEGNVGLLLAVQKFDISKGYQFSTYAMWWIRQSIVRGIENNGRNIRIPSGYQWKMHKALKKIHDLCYELGRKPTLEEKAIDLGISIDKVQEYEYYSNDTFSLDLNLSDEDDSLELRDIIPDRAETLDNLVISSDMQENVRSLIRSCKLTNREREIITLIFGIGLVRGYTNKEVSKMLGVSKQCVQQTQAKALYKILSNNQSEQFALYMDYPEESLRKLKFFRQNKKGYYTSSLEKLLMEYYVSQGIDISGSLMRKRMSRNQLFKYYEAKGYSASVISSIISNNLSHSDQQFLASIYGKDYSEEKRTLESETEKQRFFAVYHKIDHCLKRDHVLDNSSISSSIRNDIVKKKIKAKTK